MGDAQSNPTLDQFPGQNPGQPPLPILASRATELAQQLAYADFLFWETLAEMENEEIECIQLGSVSGQSGRTAKVMVADLAFAKKKLLRRLQASQTGSAPAPVRTQTDQDARVIEAAKRPWIEVEQAAQDTNQRLVEVVRQLPYYVLDEPGDAGSNEGDRTRTIAEQLVDHVAAVREQRHKVQLYCGSLDRWGRSGLRKVMEEQHRNLMDGMAGLTEETMLAARVCGAWSIRDVYTHVLGWNEYCAKLLRHWPEPNPEHVKEWEWREGDTMASFNERILLARAHLTMIEIADGLTTEYRRMLRVFDKTSDRDLSSVGLTWGGPGVMSSFFYEIFVHEAEHAAQIWAFRAGVSAEEAEMNRSDDS